jgi:hypothetical protein
MSLSFKGQLCDPSSVPPTIITQGPRNDQKFQNSRAHARQLANMSWHKYEYLVHRYGEKPVNKMLRELRDGPNWENVGSS